MSPPTSIKGMTYINSSHTFNNNNKPYASYRRPTPTTTRSASSTRSTRPKSAVNPKSQEGTFLFPRSPPLSPKPSVLYREVTVIAPASHDKRRHGSDKRPADVNSTWLMTPQPSGRNSLKDNIKHLSLNSTHSNDSKLEKATKKQRRSSINKASISRPIPQESPRKQKTLPPKPTAQPQTLDPRAAHPAPWSKFRTFANATPPLPQRSSARTFMNLSGPPSPPLTRPPTTQSSNTNLHHAAAPPSTVGSRPPTSYHHPSTRSPIPSSARDSGTASLDGDTGTSTPCLPEIPKNTQPLPTDLKSFIQWSDTDSDLASLDPANRRRTAFKRLVRQRSSLKNLRQGFDSAVEGVKRSVHSHSNSTGQSGVASVVESGRQSTARPNTPCEPTLHHPTYTQSQTQSRNLRTKLAAPPASHATSPAPTPRSASFSLFPPTTTTRARTPNPNVWISSDGVPQGVAVKRRSTHLATEDVSDLAYLEQVRKLSRVETGGSGAEGRTEQQRGQHQQRQRQLEVLREERARQVGRRAEERERERRTEEKRVRGVEKGRKRDAKGWDEKRAGRAVEKKESKSWFARIFCG